MRAIAIPYGKGTVSCEIPEGRLGQVLLPAKEAPQGTPAEILQAALQNPIGTTPLKELSRDARRVVIITDDHTRPLPSRDTLPQILAALARPPEEYEITILVATGLHRGMRPAEMQERFGKELMERYPIINHCAAAREELVSLGTLSTGNELLVNRLVTESDLVIAEGFIEPHFFAGFSGGRKSILPGVSGEETILRNHSPQHIADARASAAILTQNPVHEEAAEAAERAGLRFIVNVALNSRKEIIQAFAGDPAAAHRAGCAYVRQMMSVPVHPAEIVVTSNNGYPLDRNLYQAVKGMDTAARAAQAGGTIILAAQCQDGVGHPAFEELITSCASVEELDERMSRGHAAVDQWQVQILARILKRNRVILVSDTITQAQARRMFLDTAPDLQEALNRALKRHGPATKVHVLPDGPVVIPQPV